MIRLNKKVNLTNSLDNPKESIFYNKEENVLNINEINSNKIKRLKNKSFDYFTVTFSNDFDENCKLIKRINLLFKCDISFKIDSNKYDLKNCSESTKKDIKKALYAISIKDERQRITYLYDEIFSYLDNIWKENNPCNFCNNRCVASIKGKTAHKENGCCYSFDYSKNPFKLTENEKICKYLKEDKTCATQNISCKLFVCRYLRKNNIFNIDLNKIFLVNAFFNKHKKLVLKENFFVSKEEIINKLLEDDDYIPYFIYYLHDYCRIK